MTITIRVGQGYDVHAFSDSPGDIVLGGVRIPFERSLKAHSDGDVLLHAICDALLGAAALGDIGKHFPDTSEDYRGADSRVLLGQVIALLKASGFAPGNVDCTVVAERPRMSPHIEEMRQLIATDMGLDVSAVSVKATTTERLGFAGREEGIACYAVVLIHGLS